MHTHSNMDYQTKTRLSWSLQRSSGRENAMASNAVNMRSFKVVQLLFGSEVST